MACAFTALDIDNAILVRGVPRHLFDRQHIAARACIFVQKLRQTPLALRLHQHIGQQQREGLIADQIARAPDRVAEPKRLILNGKAGLSGVRQAGGEQLQLSQFAALFKGAFQLDLPGEVIFDDALAGAGDEDEMLDARRARFLHHMLDDGFVDDGEHFLGHDLRRR